MALFKISKGLKANLPSAKTAGYCWYTVDDSLFYIDYEDESGVVHRKALNAKDAETLSGASLATILNDNELEIPTSQAVFNALNAHGDFLIDISDDKICNKTSFEINEAYASGRVLKARYQGMVYYLNYYDDSKEQYVFTNIFNSNADGNVIIGGKVFVTTKYETPVVEYGLINEFFTPQSSTNLTTTQKNVIRAINEINEKASVQPDWNQNDPNKVDFIKNKPSIPSAASDLSYDNATSGLAATNVQDAINEIGSAKQDKLIGEEGQIVSFDADGNAIAKNGESYIDVSFTLLASAWVDGSQTVTVEGMSHDKNGILSMLDNATQEQKAAVSAAELSFTQGENTMTFTCNGIVPTIDIPLRVTIGIVVSDLEYGDMNSALYDPQGRNTDVFGYVDNESKKNVPVSADVDDTNMVSFRNANGEVLFTLDLAGLDSSVFFGELATSITELEVPEGGSATFTLALASAPSSKQPVYLAVSDNTRLSISPSSLVFTSDNWKTPQTITVTALQDEDEYDESASITVTSRKVTAKVIAVTISDDDKPMLVTDGLVLHFDYTVNTDHSSDIITDLAGGIPASGWSSVVTDANGIIGTTKAITIDTSSDAWKTFVSEMKGSTEGFTIEQFASGFGKTFSFSGSPGVNAKAMVYNMVINPNGTFWILSPATYYNNVNNESVYAQYTVDGIIQLEDGSTIAPNGNFSLLAKLPNWYDYCHTVIRFYPDGTCKRTINGCPYLNDGTISDFSSFDFDTMFSAFYMIPDDLSENAARWWKTQRIYNRILTDDEIKNNMAVEASRLGLSTF